MLLGDRRFRPVELHRSGKGYVGSFNPWLEEVPEADRMLSVWVASYLSPHKQYGWKYDVVAHPHLHIAWENSEDEKYDLSVAAYRDRHGELRLKGQGSRLCRDAIIATVLYLERFNEGLVPSCQMTLSK